MPRYPIIHIPDGIYSVTSKCNNNEFLFDAEEKFQLYLHHLLECKRKLNFIMYDLCCMSNHVHELYRVTRGITIADILHTVRGHFSQKFNARFGRSGHFWKSKPYYRIVEDEQYAFHLMNYFHLNPVKAGLVDKPENWPYSGHRFHILGEQKGLVGKLLDRIPGISQTDVDSENLYLSKLLQRQRLRFIGTEEFIMTMQTRYKRDNAK